MESISERGLLHVKRVIQESRTAAGVVMGERGGGRCHEKVRGSGG